MENEIKVNDTGEVWLVYDNECPMCSSVAMAVRIRKAVGVLHLIDARLKRDHPLVQEIKGKGIDLNDGIVIKFHDHLYYGPEALYAMAMLGTPSGWFNKMCSFIFRFPKIARFLHPYLKMLKVLISKLKGHKKLKH